MAKRPKKKQVGDPVENKKANIRIEHEIHTLPIKLDEHERAKKAQQLAEAVETLESIATAKKSAVAEFSARSKQTAELIQKLSREIRDRRAYVPVECELRLNYTTLQAQLVRTDTGVMQEERPLTVTEKQMTMEFSDDADTSNADLPAVKAAAQEDPADA